MVSVPLAGQSGDDPGRQTAAGRVHNVQPGRRQFRLQHIGLDDFDVPGPVSLQVVAQRCQVSRIVLQGKYLPAAGGQRQGEEAAAAEEVGGRNRVQSGHGFFQETEHGLKLEKVGLDEIVGGDLDTHNRQLQNRPRVGG